jgi:hypothetical protein
MHSMTNPRRACWFGVLTLVLPLASAQDIYVCTDSKGHKITSDRPIVECIDREQKVFGGGGMVKRTVGPSLTAQERVTQEDAQKREAEEQLRQAEEKRRDRALFTRYVNQAAHDQERADALIQVDEVMRASQVRLQELAQQRRDMDVELEFYRKDEGKAPSALKRRISENAQNVAAQQRFLAAQTEEKRRINQRFDEELVKLKPRWALQAAAISATAPASAAKSK